MPDRVKEFQNIVSLSNIISVMERGLLSHKRASELPHVDISKEAMQERRDKKTVPNGLKLHEYANVYFHARNPMMSSRRGISEELSVLRISKNILNLNGVVITDQNAGAKEEYVKFLAPNQIGELELEMIYAHDWRHPGNPPAFWRHRSVKCAEVLVPNVIEPSYIEGAYVVNDAVAKKLKALGFSRPIEINSYMFFK